MTWNSQPTIQAANQDTHELDLDEFFESSRLKPVAPATPLPLNTRGQAVGELLKLVGFFHMLSGVTFFIKLSG
jgi:hypothetical protein